MIFYTGIGARITPPQTCERFVRAGKTLAKLGLTLRSGAAPGADESFENGCDLAEGAKEIYLPYLGFRNHDSKLNGSSKESRIMASRFHPAWHNVGNTGRDYHGRNVCQVLGMDLETPSKFVMCWTQDGKTEGGTATAIRVAEHHNIPVFNLGKMTTDEVDNEISLILDL